jgi:hypothetical protein
MQGMTSLGNPLDVCRKSDVTALEVLKKFARFSQEKSSKAP